MLCHIMLLKCSFIISVNENFHRNNVIWQIDRLIVLSKRMSNAKKRQPYNARKISSTSGKTRKLKDNEHASRARIHLRYFFRLISPFSPLFSHRQWHVMCVWMLQTNELKEVKKKITKCKTQFFFVRWKQYNMRSYAWCVCNLSTLDWFWELEYNIIENENTCECARIGEMHAW